MSVNIIISPAENGKRLGEVLSNRGISRRLVTRLKRIPNGITRNGLLLRTIDEVHDGDVVVLNERDESLPEPNFDLKADVLFENTDLVVFGKPPLMPVHTSIKHRSDTLENFFAAHCPQTTFRPVNRLDRDTSGCVLCAKNQLSAQRLQKASEKVYYAVCCPAPEKKEGVIDAPIAREQQSIIKRCVSPDGKRAVTHYKVIAENEKYALCEIHLETGRTHQIRVHFAYIGCPLAGDDMYGGSTEDISRQALHCGEMSFSEPTTGEKIQVNAPLPDDMKKLLKRQMSRE